MNNKYIDKNTYEIVNNIFEVDEGIASTISILNKKGYHTLASCSGHIKDPRLYEKYPIENVNFAPDSYMVNNKFMLIPYLYTTIYIMFAKDYKFDKLPSGFYKENNNGIYREIDYYENGFKKKCVNIENEIEEANKDLLEWAKKLPSIKL